MAEHPGRVDVSQLQRLKEGQEQAIWETDRQLEQWYAVESIACLCVCVYVCVCVCVRVRA